MICPKCKMDWSGVKYCFKCGTKLKEKPKPPKCPSCRKKSYLIAEEDTPYCGFCGFNIFEAEKEKDKEVEREVEDIQLTESEMREKDERGELED